MSVENAALLAGVVALWVFIVGMWVALIRDRRRRKASSSTVDSYEDVLARCLMSGNVVIGNKRDDGKWDVREIPDEQ